MDSNNITITYYDPDEFSVVGYTFENESNASAYETSRKAVDAQKSHKRKSPYPILLRLLTVFLLLVLAGSLLGGRDTSGSERETYSSIEDWERMDSESRLNLLEVIAEYESSYLELDNNLMIVINERVEADKMVLNADRALVQFSNETLKTSSAYHMVYTVCYAAFRVYEQQAAAEVTYDDEEAKLLADKYAEWSFKQYAGYDSDDGEEYEDLFGEEVNL